MEKQGKARGLNLSKGRLKSTKVREQSIAMIAEFCGDIQTITLSRAGRADNPN